MNVTIPEEEYDGEPTIYDIASDAGMSDEWIQEEIIASAAALGMLAINESEAEGENLDGIRFLVMDEISEIEVIVRRVPPEERGSRTLH